MTFSFLLIFYFGQIRQLQVKTIYNFIIYRCINSVFGLPYWIYACCFGHAEVQELGSPEFCDASSNTTDYGFSSDLNHEAPNQAYERMLEQQLENSELQNGQAEKKIEILKGALKKANHALKQDSRSATPTTDNETQCAVESSDVPQEEGEAVKARLAWYDANYQKVVQSIDEYKQYSEAQQSQINALLEEKLARENNNMTDSHQFPESGPIVEQPRCSEAIPELSDSNNTSPCIVPQEEGEARKAQLAATEVDLQTVKLYVAELTQYIDSLRTHSDGLQSHITHQQTQITDLQTQLNTLQQEKLLWESTELTPSFPDVNSDLAWPTFDEENSSPETVQANSEHRLIPCFGFLPEDRLSKENAAWENNDMTDSHQDPESGPIVDQPRCSEAIPALSDSDNTSPCIVPQEEGEALRAKLAATEVQLQIVQLFVAELTQYTESLRTHSDGLQSHTSHQQTQITDLQTQLNTLQQEKLLWESTELTPSFPDVNSDLAWPTFDEENSSPETVQANSEHRLIPCFGFLPEDRLSKENAAWENNDMTDSHQDSESGPIVEQPRCSEAIPELSDSNNTSPCIVPEEEGEALRAKLALTEVQLQTVQLYVAELTQYTESLRTHSDGLQSHTSHQQTQITDLQTQLNTLQQEKLLWESTELTPSFPDVNSDLAWPTFDEENSSPETVQANSEHRLIPCFDFLPEDRLSKENAAWENNDMTDSHQDPESGPIVDQPRCSEAIPALSDSDNTSPCIVPQGEVEALRAKLAATEVDLQTVKLYVAELTQYIDSLRTHSDGLQSHTSHQQTQITDLQTQLNTLRGQAWAMVCADPTRNQETLQQEKLLWESTELSPSFPEVSSDPAWPTFEKENSGPETVQANSEHRLIPCFDILPEDRATYHQVKGDFHQTDRSVVETALVKACLVVQSLRAGQLYNTLDQVITTTTFNSLNENVLDFFLAFQNRFDSYFKV